MKIRRYINRRTVSRVLGSTLANQLADRWMRKGPPTDVFGFYSFVTEAPFGSAIQAANTPEANTINWFVPPIGKGSGGHLNIVRFIRNLEELGFESRIIVCDVNNTLPPAVIEKNVCDWFMPVAAKVYVHPEVAIPPAFVSIATGWQTAYPVRNFRSTVKRAYFVQDFEPYFAPMGSEYVFAEDTYKFGFAGITAGGWLKEKLARDYGMRTESFGFSYDRELYDPKPREPNPNRNIMVYARPVTARRGFEMTMLALKQVTDAVPGVSVIFAGWDIGGYKVPFNHHNAGSVALNELAHLYSQCDAALVVSLTNLSLLPLELMACGCPLVSNRGENVEWLLNEQNCELTDATPAGLANGMIRVLTDEGRRQEIIRNGFATAHATDWRKEAQVVATFLQELSA